jgi:putative salt-induced outer membrane protein YdiY
MKTHVPPTLSEKGCLRYVLLAAILAALGNALGSSQAQAQDAAAPAPAAEKKPSWETTASLGVTLTRGNSKTVLATANILTQKKWEQNELRFGGDAAYGEDHDVKNTESVHGFGQYNRLFTDRFYGYVRLDALHDAIADVQYRLTFSPGAGYYFIKNAQTSLSAEIGPGFIYEKQGGHTHGYPTLRIAERLDHKFNDRVKVWESVEYLPQVDKFQDYIINSEAGVDSALTKKFSLRVFAVDTYHSEPAPGREKNDLKLVTAIAYTF